MFAPVINIDNDLYDKLKARTVTLRSGQWVKLAWSDRKARWIGVSPRGIFVIQHYDGGGYSKAKYQGLLNYYNRMIKEASNAA